MKMKDTMLHVLFMFCITTSINCFPQNIPKNVSPSEVNHLLEPNKLNSNVEEQSNLLEETVREVEATLKANPKLPRLTRGEILDLLENITKNDDGVAVNQNSKDERQSKAVMKVLPFTPDSNGFNVEDLYTKPPVTQIVASQVEEENVKHELPKITNFDTAKEFKKPTEDKAKKNRGTQRYRNKLSTTPTTSIDTAQSSVNFKTISPNSFSISTNSTPFKRIATKDRTPTDIKKIRKTSTTTKYPNHKYEDEISADSSISPTIFPTSGIKIIPPPSLPPKVINEDLLPLLDANKQFYVEKEIPVSYKVIDLDVGDDSDEEGETLPLVVDSPEHLKGTYKNNPKKQNFNTKSKRPSSKLPEVSDSEEPDIKNILLSLGILPNQHPANKPATSTSTTTTSTTTTTTTTSPIPDIDNVVDTLSPEMKSLLMNFGLIPNSDSPSKSTSDSEIYFDNYNPEKAEVKPDSYVGFKPLPEDDNSRDEMQELLARFGLGRSARKQKSLDYKKNSDNNMKMDLPNEYKGILENMGWKGGSETQETTDKNQHVFNPIENLYATKDEIEKLNKLSNVVKHLENLDRPITSDDFKQVDIETLKVLVESLNNSVIPLNEQNAPDPLKFDNELIKNEVKRQQNTTLVENKATTVINTNNTISSTTQSINATELTTTQKTVTPNIKDLEDSFGGKTETTTVTVKELPPTTERTGFYYLLDWNSFFDIDDQKGKRVNLRFQPKAGDPKRFYSVTVP